MANGNARFLTLVFFSRSFPSTREQNRLVCVCLSTALKACRGRMDKDPNYFEHDHHMGWDVRFTSRLLWPRVIDIIIYFYIPIILGHLSIQFDVMLASIVETSLPSSWMRLDRLQSWSEIGSERKILYLCWKSNSENSLGIAGLHPLSPYLYALLSSARISQTLRSFCLSHMIKATT